MFLAFVLALLSPMAPQSRSLIEALESNAPPQSPEQQQRAASRTAATEACHRRFMGQDYWPQPAIWKVADTDTKIFLFGTVHVLPYDFAWRTPQLDIIVGEARTLMVEGGAVPAGQSALSGTLPPVADRLDGDARALWRGMLAMLPEERATTFDTLPTWEVAQLIDAEARRWRDPPLGLGVDNQLITAFKGAGKQVEPIENGAAADATLTAVPEADQRLALTLQLQDIVRPRTVSERMVLFHRWARGESLATSDPTRPVESGELSSRLLDGRNAAWADKLALRLKEPGTVLVAVGAGHFEGRRSLLSQLTERGFHVERVSPNERPRYRAAWVPMPPSWDACSDYFMGRKPIPAGTE